MCVCVCVFTNTYMRTYDPFLIEHHLFPEKNFIDILHLKLLNLTTCYKLMFFSCYRTTLLGILIFTVKDIGTELFCIIIDIVFL